MSKRAGRTALWLGFTTLLFAHFVVVPAVIEFGALVVWVVRQQQQAMFRYPHTLIEQPVSELPTELLRIHIDTTASDARKLDRYVWRGWNGRPQRRPEVRAAVREGSGIYTNVAIHLKGAAGSFRRFGDKPGLTLSFAKHARRQTFHGYSKISLNNSVQDPSYLCEALGRELFDAAGVPVPAADFATVLINGNDKGLYVLTEGYNKEFLRSYFTDVRGNLYDGGFCQDVNPDLEVNSGDAPDDRSDLKRLIAAASEPDAAKRWERLSGVLDIDRFMSFLALENLMCHWDGYAMNRNNYRLFHDLTTDRMVFMPHGMDQLFDVPKGACPPESPIRLKTESLVARAVLSTPDGDRLYLERIGALHATLFQEQPLIDRLRELSQRIRPTLAAYSPDAAARHDSAVESLRDRISRRIQSVSHQLNALKTSTNLVAWQTAWLTNTATDLVSLVDPTPAIDPLRFYRVKLLP